MKKEEINKTKCTECGKEIILPDGVNTDYRKEADEEEYPFCLPEDNADTTKELAHCDPNFGGYYCYTCYYKIAEEERKAEEDSGFDDELCEIVRCVGRDPEYSMCYGCWFGFGDGVEWDCEQFADMMKEYTKQKRLKEETKKADDIGNKKIKEKKCPKCKHKTLSYTSPKTTEFGLFPAHCDCSYCGYSTDIAVFDGEIIGIW